LLIRRQRQMCIRDSHISDCDFMNAGSKVFTETSSLY
jgi:hypothetical protein